MQITEPFYLENIRPIRGNDEKLASIELPEEWKFLDGNRSRGKFPGPKYESIQHNIEFIENFDKFKQKLQNQNSNAYKNYIKTPIVKEYIFKNKLLHEVLNYQETFEKISCNSCELIEFANLESKIIKYIINNPNISGKERIVYQFDLMHIFDIPEECIEINNKLDQEKQELFEFIRNENQKYLQKKK